MGAKWSLWETQIRCFSTTYPLQEDTKRLAHIQVQRHGYLHQISECNHCAIEITYDILCVCVLDHSNNGGKLLVCMESIVWEVCCGESGWVCECVGYPPQRETLQIGLKTGKPLALQWRAGCSEWWWWRPFLVYEDIILYSLTLFFAIMCFLDINSNPKSKAPHGVSSFHPLDRLTCSFIANMFPMWTWSMQGHSTTGRSSVLHRLATTNISQALPWVQTAKFASLVCILLYRRNCYDADSEAVMTKTKIFMTFFWRPPRSWEQCAGVWCGHDYSEELPLRQSDLEIVDPIPTLYPFLFTVTPLTYASQSHDYHTIQCHSRAFVTCK